MPATDLWAALTALPKPHRIVDFPRKDGKGGTIGQMAMVVLRHEDSLACIRDADAFAKKALRAEAKKDEENRGYNDLFTNEAAVQILYRACRDAKDLKRSAFPSPKAMKLELSDDEIAVLYNTYDRIRVELGPIISHMTPEEMDAWLDRLAEGGQSFPLGLLSSEMLGQLLMRSAFRLRSSQTGKSSAGPQPSESETALPQIDELDD